MVKQFAESLKERAEKCEAQKLCFVSLKPLAVTSVQNEFKDIYHFGLKRNVSVNNWWLNF